MTATTASAIACVGEGLFELGCSVGAPELREGYGGDAANVAVMARRAGVPARLIGRVGADELGQRLRAFWLDEGIDCRDLVVDDERSTGMYVNVLHADGRHRFDYHRTGSAGSALGPDDVHRCDLDGARFLVGTGVTISVSESSAAAWSALGERAIADGVSVAFAVNWRPQLRPDRRLMLRAARRAAVVFLSREDAAYLLAEDSLESVVGAFPEAQEIVVTDGAQGAWAFDATGARVHAHVPSVRTRDTAGAGDALMGAYLACRAARRTMADAIRWATIAASLSTQAHRCAASYPSADEVDVHRRA